MAILTSDTLSGCSSIPSFLGGSGDTPSNPSVTIFRNTNAPLNWVKKTTENDKALRIIGGTNGTALAPGGATAFSTIFSASRTFSASFNPAVTGLGNTGSGPNGFSPTDVSMSPGSTDSYTPTTPETAAHSHPTEIWQPALTSAGPLTFTTLAAALLSGTTSSGSPAGGTAHAHTISAPHAHPLSDSGHTHAFNSESPHTHPFSATTQSFAVNYVDIIIATKS